MAGRGRGRGQSVSFNIEQLGFGRGEAVPVSVSAPPPLFPPLENRSLPLIKDIENEYLLVTQKDLNTRMRSSSFYLKAAAEINKIQQYSDKIHSTPIEKELHVLWNRVPAELKRSVNGKRLPTSKSKSSVKAKRFKNKNEDPDKILAKLEEKEKVESEGEGAGDGIKEDEDDEKGNTDDEEKVEMEDDIEDIDEEMDEGTDYARDYFDNGEGYLDEDDNLDDGEAQF